MATSSMTEITQGTAAKALGGPVMLHRVVLGANQTNEGPPLSRVPLFLRSMFRNSKHKISISKTGQVPGGIISQPFITGQVVPWREFRRLEFANTQLGGNAGESFKIPMYTKHAMM